MCQSKATGGRRCAFHLAKDVGAAVVTYTAAMTGMSKTEVTGAYEDLVTEGAHKPAPSREEVDQFLTAQAFRVSMEPNLTEGRRESILRRLRAGIGRVTPTGAVFHAWKNVVAEAWARSRRRAAAAFLVSVAFTAGGCASGTQAQQSPAPTPSVSVSASATPGPSPSASSTAPTVTAPDVDAATLATFGKADVTKAWAKATAAAEGFAYNPDLMNKAPEDVNAKDFTALRAQMTPTAAKDWDKFVAALPDSKASSAVNGLAMQGLNTSGYKINTTKPVTDYTISGTAQTSPEGALMLAQTQKATIHALDPSGAQIKYTSTKSVTYYMKKVGGDWKIDGWRATGDNSTVTPDA